jgi:hypothetical protein
LTSVSGSAQSCLFQGQHLYLSVPLILWATSKLLGFSLGFSSANWQASFRFSLTPQTFNALERSCWLKSTSYRYGRTDAGGPQGSDRGKGLMVWRHRSVGGRWERYHPSNKAWQPGATCRRQRGPGKIHLDTNSLWKTHEGQQGEPCAIAPGRNGEPSELLSMALYPPEKTASIRGLCSRKFYMSPDTCFSLDWEECHFLKGLNGTQTYREDDKFMISI